MILWPHFEPMLCDNAEGVPVYFEWFLIVPYFDYIVASKGQNLKKNWNRKKENTSLETDAMWLQLSGSKISQSLSKNH